MRLAGIEVRDFRSIFVDEGGKPLRLDLGPGMNTLVGFNNCGKSNVLRAVSLALDPNHPFDPDVDAPGPRSFSLPIITLRFIADGDRDEERAALEAAEAYERSLGVGDCLADRGEIVLQVAFQPAPDGVHRRERLLSTQEIRPASPEQHDLLDHALACLRRAVRFVLISSGESLESVLEGNFREILHSVVRERLGTEFSEAEASRKQYLGGLQESLLAPLRERLGHDVSRLFPEIGATRLSPEVPSIEATLSNVAIELEDVIATPLSGKGTGVRGGVLVAMLSYLAANANRAMVFAVEEPEAFLHPASQEDLRDDLEALAGSPDVSLLVTTHSPFIVTGSPTGRVFCVAKDGDGRTRVAQSASGDAPHAPLIGDLFREASLDDLLAQTTALPPGTEGILLVEGDGDVASLHLAARVTGREDLLAGIHIKPAGGTNRIAVEAVIARAASELPVFILLDNDDHGRESLKLLTNQQFKFQKTKEVTTYAEAFPKDERNFPYEAEDVFAAELMAAFVDEHGDSVIDGTKKRPDGAYHYDLNQAAKAELTAYLEAATRPEHIERWVELILLIRQRLGLAVIDQTAAEIVADAPAVASTATTPSGRVLVQTDPLHQAQYTNLQALVLDVDDEIPPEVTHIGFYSNGAIQVLVPRIEADYPGLLFSRSTVRQLRETGSADDAAVAAVVQQSLDRDDDLANATHRLLLLSAPDAEQTIVLNEPVRNTTTHNGKPLAWAVAPRPVPLAALGRSPATTDELQRFEEEL